MKTSMTINSILGLAAMLLFGCGANPGKKSDAKKSDSNADATMHLAQQDQCNAQGVVYDTVAKPVNCSRFKLVSWNCSIDEISNRVSSAQGSMMFKNNMADMKARGYVATQCGEFDGETFVTFAISNSTAASSPSAMFAKVKYKVINEVLSSPPVEYSGAH